MGEWLLKRFLLADECHEKLGDFEEGYHIKTIEKGKHKAFAWYWLQLILTIPVFVKNLFYWRLTMFKNYLKDALRNIKKHKGYSFINIVGIAVGIACSMIVLLYVSDELSYDKHHKNADRIYRVRVRYTLDGKISTDTTYSPELLASTLKNEFPEIEAAARFTNYGFPVFRYRDKVFSEEKVFRADNSIFDIFSFEFISGDPKEALIDQNSIVLTQSSAKKYFGKENPIGRVINADKRRDLTVTAVIKDIPRKSHFHFDFLIPLREADPQSNWLNLPNRTYVLLKKNATMQDLSRKLEFTVSKYLAPFIEKSDNMPWNQWTASGNKAEYLPQALTRIHLHSNIGGEFELNGNITSIYFISLIGLALLIIACINYINLETARASKRFREIGMRKTLGAKPSQIAFCVLTESMLMSFFSFTLALLLVNSLLPVFNNLFGTALVLPLLDQVALLPVIFASIFFIGVVTGLYPSIVLMKVKTSRVIKGFKSPGKNRSFLRNALVVFQFAASIFIIIATWIVFSQIKYSLNMELGFNKDQLMVIHKVDDIAQSSKIFKQNLLTLPDVFEVTNSSTVPGKGISMSYHRLYGGDINSNLLLRQIYADYDFLNTYQINLLEGRNFSKDFGREIDAVILNQTAVKVWGLDDPVDKHITPIGSGRKLKVIGVVEDFHFSSAHESVQPLKIGLFSENGYGGYLTVRVNPQNIQNTIKKMEKQWQVFAGKQAFEYSFVDSQFEALYYSEKELGHLFSVFAILAVFIACLGLLGLATFSISQRTKEIGIRKTLGASVPDISALLLKEFLRWVLVAACVAWPLSYLIMKKWLSGFAYRTSMTVWAFLGSSVAALIIAVISVSYQSIKAALATPVDSLRYE